MRELLVCKNAQCMLASFAMVMDANPDQWVKDFLGHDGLERINNDPEPWCFRGFHPQEFVELIVNVYGEPVTQLSRFPMMLRYQGTLSPQPECRAWSNYILRNDGVLCGTTVNGTGHVVASLEGEIYDPKGRTYGYNDCEANDFIPEHFFLVGEPK